MHVAPWLHPLPPPMPCSLIGNAFALPPEAFLDEGVISKAYDFLGTGSVALWTLAGREYLEREPRR